MIGRLLYTIGLFFIGEPQNVEAFLSDQKELIDDFEIKSPLNCAEVRALIEESLNS